MSFERKDSAAPAGNPGRLAATVMRVCDVETLQRLNPQYPRVDAAAKKALADAKNKLLGDQA